MTYVLQYADQGVTPEPGRQAHTAHDSSRRAAPAQYYRGHEPRQAAEQQGAPFQYYRGHEPRQAGEQPAAPTQYYRGHEPQQATERPAVPPHTPQHVPGHAPVLPERERRSAGSEGRMVRTVNDDWAAMSYRNGRPPYGQMHMYQKWGGGQDAVYNLRPEFFLQED